MDFANCLPILVQVTVCLRSQHLSYSGPPSSTYAVPFAIGNLLPDWSNYYEGEDTVLYPTLAMVD